MSWAAVRITAKGAQKMVKKTKDFFIYTKFNRSTRAIILQEKHLLLSLLALLTRR
ncbi:MAG: hypothetical protein K0R82_762 [Flavipsychrobacter sp.]|nr:hypothetical protein [Flavipsychrobacter sp.]